MDHFSDLAELRYIASPIYFNHSTNRKPLYDSFSDLDATALWCVFDPCLASAHCVPYLYDFCILLSLYMDIHPMAPLGIVAVTDLSPLSSRYIRTSWPRLFNFFCSTYVYTYAIHASTPFLLLVQNSA